MDGVSEEGARYYADPDVQQRIREYCGAVNGVESCAFVSQLAPAALVTWASAPRRLPSRLPELFTAGWDISRSLLDHRSLIVYFEIDVDDPDAPDDALLRPAQTFFDLEPVYRAVRTELTRLDWPLLDVMTGRGYHFSGQVPFNAPVVSAVARLAPLDAPAHERAHIGLGMVLELLAHNVHRRAAHHGIPVVFDGVEVGRGGLGREAVSLDLSGYGDPVGERQMRVAFGTYQSHRVRPDLFGDRAAKDVPVIVAVPRRGRAVFWMLEQARTTEQAAALAPFEHSELPDATGGLAKLVEEYEVSRLATFHRAFYDERMYGPNQWADTYDRWSQTDVVPCVAFALQYPNDALLKPTVLQHVTRYLMANGWSPRHIAGIVWSKYARDYQWGERWSRLDAQRRAEFDVRVFAGAIVSGLDQAIDFNCVSSQEKGLCPHLGCSHDLRDDRERLFAKAAL